MDGRGNIYLETDGDDATGITLAAHKTHQMHQISLKRPAKDAQLLLLRTSYSREKPNQLDQTLGIADDGSVNNDPELISEVFGMLRDLSNSEERLFSQLRRSLLR